MKSIFAFNAVLISLNLLFLCLEPSLTHAQSGATVTDDSPVAQQLVREGAFAVKLLASMGVGASEDEADAENRLAGSGIAPRNGWIADYPVTPDIVCELRKALTIALESGKVELDKYEALRRFEKITGGFNISAEPATVSVNIDAAVAGSHVQPDPVSIMNYFATMGPPVITYYPPPPEYSHLYCLVPYPFRSRGVRFPGFFILKEFHRTIFVKGRVAFVTNNFHVFRNHRVFRIDPIARYNGKTFAGIGVSTDKNLIDTGIPDSKIKLFNGPQPWIRSHVRGAEATGGHLRK